jgi:uncharacterized protein
MSEENVEIVRRGYEAYNRGDVDGVVADFARDCEYIATGALPGTRGVFRGPEGYEQFIAWVRSEFDDARIEVTELIDAGNRVFVSVTLRGRGRQSGVPTTWSFWQVWTMLDGEVVRGQAFVNRDEALEAAGLRE